MPVPVRATSTAPSTTSSCCSAAPRTPAGQRAGSQPAHRLVREPVALRRCPRQRRAPAWPCSASRFPKRRRRAARCSTRRSRSSTPAVGAGDRVAGGPAGGGRCRNRCGHADPDADVAACVLCRHPALAGVISATMVRLSLEHGNTEDSAYGYVTHAITIGPVTRDYASAYEWGELALRRERALRRSEAARQDSSAVPRPRQVLAPAVRRRAFRTRARPRRSGLETGDFTYAGYGAVSESWPAFVISKQPRPVRPRLRAGDRPARAHPDDRLSASRCRS